jgi:2-polyprenyl-6-methoxyphenol hydroxylase-like FAD-dependent oxidoreductase
MTSTPEDGGHAVVIGASMTGLAVAKALVGYFDRVTVLDRDVLPESTMQRRGVPQGRHIHVLLTAGKQALEDLFPGITDEMSADGAIVADLGLCTRMYVNGHRLALAPAGDEDVVASRPFVESHVRARLRDEPAVTLIERREARELVVSDDGRRVVGVEVASRDGDSATEQMDADLVVDCSGRRSPSPQWLEGLGGRPPPVDELRVDLQYATRRYRLPPDILDGDLLALITPLPDTPRGGSIGLMEDGEWIVTLAGMGGTRPPLDRRGFEDYAASLAAPDIHDAIVQGQPLDEPAPYRYPANRRQRYERLRDIPQGFLVAGDAVGSFNPIYGQGMTVAALEARMLRDLLDRGAVPDPRTWFRMIAPIVDVPWDLAVGGDLTVRCIEGHRPLQIRLANAYMERYYRAAEHDPTLGVLFMRVSSLLEPPTRLTRPTTMTRVLRGNLRRRPGSSDAPRGPMRDHHDVAAGSGLRRRGDHGTTVRG